VDQASSAARIVFINRFFHPDISATSQMTSDLAFALAREGFAVSAICSRQRYDDAAAELPATESCRGVTIRRVASTRFGRQNLLGRALDFLSFYLTSLWALLLVLRRGDVVVAETDPPLISLVAGLVAWLRGAELVNWLQDVFPEVATELQANPLPRWLDGGLRKLRNLSLRRAHCNVVLGTRMRDHVLQLGVAAERICVIENWADGHELRPIASLASRLRSQHGLGSRFVVGYSGNLGRAHEFSTLLEAATDLKDDSSIVFLMTGGGAGMQALEAEVANRGLDNFRFLPYQPREQLSDSLGSADVHLVSLKPELEGLIVPSKFYGVLAAGRPSIFIGDTDGELSRVIRRHDVGYSVACGDSKALAGHIRSLSFDPEHRETLGERSRALFNNHYTLQRAVREWSGVLRGTGVGAQAADPALLG